ncbi:hypothetical protein ACSFA8_02930 [Variovorax sp. RT4R15]|uniref:hypothetical protein n=1 Tax=Variovorax sp. RT4R15 TaxID=3443737 RepID=UPI003F48EFCD
MSSPAFLYAADSDALVPSIRGESFSLSANFIIPVFWLALYDPADLRRAPDAEPDDFAAWYLSTAAGIAIDRLEKRRRYLVEALPDGSEIVFSMFVSFLKGSAGLHIQCDPQQALSIQDADDGWELTLKRILNAFNAAPRHVVRKRKFLKTVEVEEPTAGWTSYFRYFGKLQEPRYQNPQQLAAALVGWGDNVDASWNVGS